ncbi:MAG: hypothetical protein LBF13_02130, partial [Campylobacteraceae bacterium]|nr:hypothetical protein [Campylobacteraceae bacterium]
MASSTTKFKVSSLFQSIFFSILTGFFLIGCGGDNSNDVSTTGSSDYIISFYDENLDFVDTAQ